MEKISCSIIRDILPLYLDDVVSEDTRKMVEEHLKSCESCQKEVDAAKSDVVLPIDQTAQLAEAAVLKGLKKKLRIKKAVSSAVAVLVAAAALIGLFLWLMTAKIFIPYDSAKFSVSTMDGKMYAQYTGGFSGSVGYTASLPGLDGEGKNVFAFYCYETPWSKYVEPIFKQSASRGNHLISLGDAERVCYGKVKINDDLTELSASLEGFDLIWSR